MAWGLMAAAVLIAVAIWAALEGAFAGAEVVLILHEEDPEREGASIERAVAGLLGWESLSIAAAVAAGLVL